MPRFCHSRSWACCSVFMQGSAHGTLQMRISLAVLAMFCLVAEFAGKAAGNKGKAEAQKQCGHCALSSHVRTRHRFSSSIDHIQTRARLTGIRPQQRPVAYRRAPLVGLRRARAAVRSEQSRLRLPCSPDLPAGTSMAEGGNLLSEVSSALVSISTQPLSAFRAKPSGAKVLWIRRCMSTGEVWRDEADSDPHIKWQARRVAAQEFMASRRTFEVGAFRRCSRSRRDACKLRQSAHLARVATHNSEATHRHKRLVGKVRANGTGTRGHGTKAELISQLYGTSPELESHDARTHELQSICLAAALESYLSDPNTP
ncbi:hypothetical protein VTO73DRAFT_9817 [Trametes versicolor]